MINDDLRKYLNIFVIAYLNDILIYLKTLKQHVNHVKKILTCLKKRNLLLKSKKCEFHKIEIEFLEFVMRREEIRINIAKIRAITKWQKSIDVQEIQSFLEFFNYNRKFIKNYLEKATSLIDFTTKNKSWTWQSNQQKAFDYLKQAQLENSMLKMFDSRKSFRAETDASNLVIEETLCQEHDDKWHSMTYLSRKLSSTEQNYDIHDKKLLTIVIALKKWKIYVKKASKLIIFTNHKNLLHFTITKQLNRRQVKWSKLLK